MVSITVLLWKEAHSVAVAKRGKNLEVARRRRQQLHNYRNRRSHLSLLAKLQKNCKGGPALLVSRLPSPSRPLLVRPWLCCGGGWRCVRKNFGEKTSFLLAARGPAGERGLPLEGSRQAGRQQAGTRN